MARCAHGVESIWVAIAGSVWPRASAKAGRGDAQKVSREVQDPQPQVRIRRMPTQDLFDASERSAAGGESNPFGNGAPIQWAGPKGRLSPHPS